MKIHQKIQAVLLVIALSACSASPDPIGVNVGDNSFSPAEAKWLQGDYAEALAELLPEAGRGDAAAQFMVGMSYRAGLGIDRDPAEAVRWLSESAGSGSTSAMNILGLMHIEGEGVAQDIPAGLELLRDAVARDDDAARLSLAGLYRKGLPDLPPNPKAAEALLGNIQDDQFGPLVAYEAALILSDAPEGMRDEARSLELMHMSAEAGFAAAQYWLYRAYQAGDFVEADAALALYWLQEAARRHYSEAQWELGMELVTGNNIEADPARAVGFFQLAALSGNPRGMTSLAVMYATGNGVGQNYATALAWYGEAAELGLAEAQRSLGYMYWQGQGSRRDVVEAMKWITLAADQGDKRAIEWRDQLGEGLSPAVLAEAKRRVEHWRTTR